MAGGMGMDSALGIGLWMRRRMRVCRVCLPLFVLRIAFPSVFSLPVHGVVHLF